MLDKDKEKRLSAVKIAKSINSIEGVPVPEETEEIFSMWIEGKITDEQLTSAMLSICAKI
ncbi:MAG: antitoxin VbhA family protein [Ruminococcus sp.]